MEHTMLAIRVNRNTWPIAAALLSADFIDRPFDSVKGGYVVINVPLPAYPNDSGPGTTVITNEFYNKDDFKRLFTIDKNSGQKDGFFRIQKQEKVIVRKFKGPGGVQNRVVYSGPRRKGRWE